MDDLVVASADWQARQTEVVSLLRTLLLWTGILVAFPVSMAVPVGALVVARSIGDAVLGVIRTPAARRWLDMYAPGLDRI